ncbi:unnamed protein product [Hymenolepis diminuta]|uniref:Uncharacterized protein n=1 Tax=Hymenolepis diminuta TaxID=6216 RepID=A0A564Y0N3_HYMDI|nr:unnamed protein product [Hymenolepis diminuta]
MQFNVSRRRYETLCINGLHVDLEVDTDSDNTIVSDESWKTLGSHNEDTVPFKVSRASGDAATSNITCASATNASKRQRTTFANILRYGHRRKPHGSGINNPNDLRHSDWSTVSKKSRFAVNTSVDARDYRLSRKWTAGIIVTRHGAMIYDVEVGWWRTPSLTSNFAVDHKSLSPFAPGLLKFAKHVGAYQKDILSMFDIRI